MPDRSMTSFRIRNDVRDRLDALTQETHTGRSQLINEYLAAYLGLPARLPEPDEHQLPLERSA